MTEKENFTLDNPVMYDKENGRCRCIPIPYKNNVAEPRYIYVLKAYAYSDIETHILFHKTNVANRTFFKIIKKAQQLCKNKNYLPNDKYVDYAMNMIACLCQEFGFESFDYPCVSIGCSTDSECALFTDDGVIVE